MIGKRAESILNRALASAVDGKHEFLTLEHVMLVLLDEPEIIQVVHHCKGSPEKLREDLRAYLQK
jgi:ATP-dependent Clp protease ATP-binding subunit ClpA